MWNPSRRNRNIGTAKSGHGANNRLTIPDRWTDLSAYWERLRSFVAVEKRISDHTITFLVEPPRVRYLYYCTVQDVLRVLGLLPAEHVACIDLFVLRQPTTKQTILAPIWGRLAYWSEIGRYQGTGIYLEAQPVDLHLKWKKSLRPDDKAELARLRAAGFGVNAHSRGFDIQGTASAIRASQLYRTIPHEIGHYVDFLECQESYVYGDDDRFWELYDAKPTREKEVYAHRYADDFRQQMTANRLIPFAPLYDAETIRADRLDPAWFASPNDAA